MIPHDFPLDGFQRDAGRAVADGENVLVCAPTGAGKTVVGEMAVSAALESGGRAFYTAPIKALSNQKHRDLSAALGAENVGLLTGDRSIRPSAPVVVMTTEVLRNMVLGGATLDDLLWVVLDEVHFLQDSYRGPVWEEVLIHTPAHVRFACLSATVSNSTELGDWIGSLRGPTATIVETTRPVELDQLLLVGDRHAERDHLVPLLVDGQPNPEGHRFDAEPRVRATGRPPRRRFRTPRRIEVVERLGEEGLLPAIHFIFSRAGCDEAATACRDAGIRLTGRDEAARITAILERHAAGLDAADLGVLGYDRWADVVTAGIAAHHAGMVPAFREAVEECFTEGLVKVVFATETLALGINMPARSVVIERLSKYTGDGHSVLTPSQYTQLTGRAGRRGIDVRGAAVVLWSPFVGFAQMAALAASRDFELESVFRPTYNMAANLVARHDRAAAEEVLGRSFAQFRADRSVVGLRTRLSEVRSELATVRSELEAAGGDRVDAEGYVDALDARAAAERRAPGGSAAIERSLAGLRPGDVVRPDTGSVEGLAVVVAVAQRRKGVQVQAVTPRGRPLRLRADGLRSPVASLATVPLPVPYAPSDPAFRREAAARLRRVNRRRLRPAQSPEEARASEEAADRVRAHPLHGSEGADALVAAVRRRRKLEREEGSLQRRLEGRGTDLVARLDGVVAVLEEFGHLRGWSLTPSGARLRRIYNEVDLLVSVALDRGLFADLDPASVAALASCFTHEHRSSEPPPPPHLPTAELRERFARCSEVAVEVRSAEARVGLPPSRELSAGFAVPAHLWAGGAQLAVSLSEEMTGGDFVRNTRSLIDLLRQLGDVADARVAGSCRAAVAALARDVVEPGGERA